MSYTRKASEMLHGRTVNGAVGVIDQAPNGWLTYLTETTMSNPHLPAGILDLTIEFLHGAGYVPVGCCFISGSRIPRTRTHLFAGHQAQD